MKNTDRLPIRRQEPPPTDERQSLHSDEFETKEPAPDECAIWEEPDANEADEVDTPMEGDDPRWDVWLDVFLPDDDEIDPMPQPGDFWTDDQGE